MYLQSILSKIAFYIIVILCVINLRSRGENKLSVEQNFFIMFNTNIDKYNKK